MPSETRKSRSNASSEPPSTPKPKTTNYSDVIQKLEQEVLRLSTQAAEKDTLVNNMAEKIKKMDERIVQLEYDQLRNQSYFIIHERTTHLLQQRIDQLEQYTRRYSVIVKGIAANRTENQESLKTQVSELVEACNSSTKFEDVDKFHRNGPVKDDKNQDLIIRFRSHQAKEQFYNNRKNIADKRVKIQPSLSPERKKLLEAAREQVNAYNEDNPNTKQNLPHFVLPDVHGNLLVKMKNRTPRGLFLKFNSLQELHAIINKHHTTDANKAFDEMMKKDEGVPTPDTNAKMTPEVVNSSSGVGAPEVVVGAPEVAVDVANVSC